MRRLALAIVVIAAVFITLVTTIRLGECQLATACCILGRCYYLLPDQCARSGGRIVPSCDYCR